MLGNRFLPESVVSVRRRFRERVNQARRPVREFREENVPGPDVIGRIENQAADLRSQVVQRESVIEKIRNRRGGSGSGGGGTGSSNNSDSNQMV